MKKGNKKVLKENKRKQTLEKGNGGKHEEKGQKHKNENVRDIGKRNKVRTKKMKFYC